MLRAATLVLLTLFALTACSSGDDSSSSSPGSAGAEPAVGTAVDSAASAADSGSAAGAPAAADPAQFRSTESGSAAVKSDRAVVRTADLVLTVGGLASAAAQVRATAEAVGGSVASEVTDTQSVLTLRVPEKSLDATLSKLSGYGDVVSRSTTAQDVTADLADQEARLESQRRSVARVQQLMSKAEKLSDIVMLEGELSKRQSELEALSASRAALADQAAMASVTVTLRTEAAAKDDDHGFLAGLAGGWDALKASTLVTLTVIGAVLPFAVVVAVLGALFWALRRRFRPAPSASS